MHINIILYLYGYITERTQLQINYYEIVSRLKEQTKMLHQMIIL